MGFTHKDRKIRRGTEILTMISSVGKAVKNTKFIGNGVGKFNPLSPQMSPVMKKPQIPVVYGVW